MSTNEQFASNEDDLAIVQRPSTITILYMIIDLSSPDSGDEEDCVEAYSDKSWNDDDSADTRKYFFLFVNYFQDKSLDYLPSD